MACILLMNMIFNPQSRLELCYNKIVAGLPHKINSWLMPIIIKYDLEQYLHKVD